MVILCATVLAANHPGRCKTQSAGNGQESHMVPPNVTHQAVLEEVGKIPAEYLPFLLERLRAFRESITLKSAAESFQRGWQEALCGETQPVSELWEGLDAG